MCTKEKRSNLCPNLHAPPHTLPLLLHRAFFLNLSIYCRLYKGVQDPVSFTVTTGLLGRLGLGLRVRVSIRIIFTFFSEFIINLFPYCNKSRYERHLSNVSLNDQSKFSRKIVSCCCRLPWIFTENIAKRQRRQGRQCRRSIYPDPLLQYITSRAYCSMISTWMQYYTLNMYCASRLAHRCPIIAHVNKVIK